MKKSKLLLILSLAIILIVVPLMTSCATTGPAPTAPTPTTPTPTAPAPEKIFKIGVCFPVSGFASALGVPLNRGVHLVADEINAHGGFKVAGETYKIECVDADTKYTPEGVVAAINKLVYTDKVKYVIGPVIGFEAEAAQSISEKEHVILLCAGFTPDIIGPDKPYTYKVGVDSHLSFALSYGYVTEKYPNVKKVYLLEEVSESGNPSADSAKSYCEYKGLEVVGLDFHDPAQEDFTTILGKGLAAKPDIISMACNPPQFALAVKQARELGYKGLFELAIPFPDQALVAIAGKEAAYGCIGNQRATVGDYATDASKEFRKTYTEKYKSWDDTALDLCLSLPVLVQAIETANSLDVDKVRAVLDSDRWYDTLTGKVRFWGKNKYGINHQMMQPMIVVETGEGGVVNQVKFATAEQQISAMDAWGK